MDINEAMSAVDARTRAAFGLPEDFEWLVEDFDGRQFDISNQMRMLLSGWVKTDDMDGAIIHMHQLSAFVFNMVASVPNPESAIATLAMTMTQVLAVGAAMNSDS